MQADAIDVIETISSHIGMQQDMQIFVKVHMAISKDIFIKADVMACKCARAHL